MPVHRRNLVESLLVAAATSAVLPRMVSAQESTPVTTPVGFEGYGIVRVRALETPELTEAIFPHVMANLVPGMSQVPGYHSYSFITSTDDPRDSITLSLLDSEDALPDIVSVTEDYVANLEPRLMPETPLSENGPIRLLAVTDRPVSELPPFLSRCSFTLRNRVNAPGVDPEVVAQSVKEGLVPLLQEMDGFVAYCWLQTEDGRCAFNIWETPEQTAAGNERVAEWVANHPEIAAEGEAETHSGTVRYSDILLAQDAHGH